MRKIMLQLGSLMAAFSLAVAYGWFGKICYTWFYQPPTPQALRDMEL